MMSLTLQKFRGALALVGQEIHDMATTALESGDIDHSFSPLESTAYHITLATKDELRTVDPQRLIDIKLDTRYIFSLGLGGKPRAGIYWIVVIWSAGQNIRKLLGLAPKHFHITLSANDQHDIDKGITSLVQAQSHQVFSVEVLDHIIFTFQAFGQYDDAKIYAARLIIKDHTSYKGFLRLGDAAFSGQESKTAMLSYACAYERAMDNRVQLYCIKKLVECSKGTEWGQIFQEYEIIQLSLLKEVSHFLLTPWSAYLRQTLSDHNSIPTLLLEPRQALFIPSPKSIRQANFYKLPRFFRWLIHDHLAIMTTPRNEDDITALSSPYLGIRHVLTLTEEEPLAQSWFEGKSITNTFLPIPNFHPPSIEQMDIIMRLFDDQKKHPLLVHCGGGKGRAGTVAACYLAACGFGKPSRQQEHPVMAAADAISALRALRPGSLETAQQEAFVATWCSTIWKRQSIYPDLPSEPPPCPLEIEGVLPENADLFVLVGLPGSGKSWFSKSLIARNPQGWARISQDDAGSRAFCETEIGRSPQQGQRVLLDRCNTSPDDRKRWIELASNWCTAPVCIWFDYDTILCTSRAQMRANHPTLPPGGRVRSAVEQMKKIFVKPSLEEGFKAIVTIRSFEAAQEAVRLFSPTLAINKFPRTPHLIDVGAATDDDLHADLSTFTTSTSTSISRTNPTPDVSVTVTEKIDGANMGFTLSSDRTRILVQNRSHYVNPSTHEQFKKLGAWLATHNDDLRHILDRDPYFAERYILYGEWMYATHSIAYTHLPDWFLAYDLYDRSTRAFVDRKTLENLVDRTRIELVPIVHQGVAIPSAEELLGMVQRKSAFYDSRVEGVYVKIETKGWVKLRGKVVRSDFISGNEHWTRGGIRVNGLRVMS